MNSLVVWLPHFETREHSVPMQAPRSIQRHKIAQSDEDVEPAISPERTVLPRGADGGEVDAVASRACFIDARRVISRWYFRAFAWSVGVHAWSRSSRDAKSLREWPRVIALLTEL